MPRDRSPRSHDWMPESALRDALIAGKLPHAIRDHNLFWINVRQYLQHEHADLPPDDYLRHWQQIYECCLSEDISALRGLSYVSFEDPYARKSQH
jgi:hypothetical protein